MEKKEQLLVINPQNELRFRGPFNQSITSYMHLTNPTDKTILFKIKTTAPKKYCVRPNCGHLLAQETTDIAICLQPFLYDPNERNKHKFMVQSLVIPDGEEPNFEQLWRDATPEHLMDSKLRCVFELPVDNKAVKSTVSQTNQAPNEPGVVSQTPPSMDKPGDSNIDMTRVTTEMRQLREDESKLRQENLQLQEQILRLRMAVEANRKESAAYENTYSPPPANQVQQPLPLLIGLAIALAIIGIILGKFVL